MAQQVRVLAALPEDLSLVPSPKSGWFTTASSSSSWGSDAVFWPLQALPHRWQTLTQTLSHTNR